MANRKEIACGGREKSRINWRPYNPNNRNLLAVVCLVREEFT